MFVSDLLQDKRVLVTGGGTGLGKAMARRSLDLGARVSILGRREEVLAETKVEFDKEGISIPFPRSDVSGTSRAGWMR